MTTDFRLGEWTVRPQQHRIERGGRTVSVKPKSMAVLECLARANGEVVERQAFFDAVWPGGVVTDDTLTQCIVELRKAFGDSPRKPRIIETIPRTGFRLIPAVVSASGKPGEAAAEPSTRRRLTVLLALVAAAALALVSYWYVAGTREIPQDTPGADAKSLAVLPFVDMSEAGDQGYFADGLTEELITWLAQLKGLKVAGRTSSFFFKNRNEDMRGIANALGVNHLLEGSVRRDGDRLRISAQLIEAQSGFHVWSKQYDTPFDDYFTVQEEIAGSVAEALSIKLQVGELGTIPGGTVSIEAYEEILASKRAQWESTPESIVRAIGHAERAVEIDPGFALAWVRLAGLRFNAAVLLGTESEPDAFEPVEQALERARSLVPGLPGALTLTIQVYGKTRQWAKIEETLDRGEGLQASADADLIRAYGGFLLRVGRTAEAIPLFERVRALSPLDNGAARALAGAYVDTGRLEEGLAEAERAYAKEGFEAWDVEAGILGAQTANDAELVRKWLVRAERHAPQARYFVAAMTESLDDSEAALAWLRKTHQQSDAYDYYIASWAAWHGDTELALDALRSAPSPFLFWHKVMRGVRSQPGFKDLVRQAGMVDYFREYGWNDFCRPVGEDDFTCE